jgi:hypothetical protein
MQTIRLIKSYAYHAKGQVLTLAPGIASELIRTGRAEAVAVEPQKVEKVEKKSNKQWRQSKTTKK